MSQRPLRKFPLSVLFGWLAASLGGVAVCWLLYWHEARQLETWVTERELVRVGLFARLFGQDFSSVAANTRILAADESLRDFVAGGGDAALADFAAEANRFSREHGIYDQVRFVDERGMERVRVSLAAGVLPPDQLQDKSDRPFFREAMRLRPGEIYVSTFDLNVEHGKLDQPWKPTLRFATPVFDQNNTVRGVVVINVLGARQFERFRELAPAYAHRLRVLNAAGYWLRGARAEDEWGFMLPERSERTLARSHPEVWRDIASHAEGARRDGGGLIAWRRISPLQIMRQLGASGRSGDPWLVIASEISAEEWAATFRSLRQSFVSLGVVLLVAVAIAGWIFRARRRAAEDLQRVDALNAAILRSAGVAVIATDTQGTITAFNPTAERLLGWRAEELVGRKTSLVFHAPEEIAQRRAVLASELGRGVPDGFETLVARARAGATDAGEWTYVRKDGERVPVLRSVVALRDARGAITGFLGVAVDITEQKRAEEVLREARRAAEESARMKSQFLANMSHEIRTPMNGVVGMANLLLDTELTPEQRMFAHTIRGSADALLAIINDILDFSKIEAGMLRFEQVPFDIRDPVENCLAITAEKAHAKNVELAYLIEDNVPTHLLGDPGRVHQILLNLVGNAVKFTDRGEVVVRVAKIGERPAPEGPRARLRVSVSDTGIGLSAEAMAKLFQPFVQADSGTTRKFGGTGLGLAICRQLVQLMGGEIGVESEPGRGATFSFTLELPLAGGVAKVVPRRAELGGRRALVVDDNATNREILQRQLAAWKIEAEGFADGAAALLAAGRAAREGRAFTFALLDMHMPGMDGLQLARRLKADPDCAALKIVILSSMGSTIPAGDLKQAGVLTALTKPVRHAQLHDTLVAALAGAAREEPRAKPLVASASRVDVKPLRILLAEDNLVNQNVARMQLAKFGYQATMVGDGRAAVAAVKTNPFDVILMDCQMPEMDGFEATRAIRAWEHDHRAAQDGEGIYIIAMTANAMEGDREACLAAGMNDYVSKPVRPADLAAALARAPAASAVA